MTFVLKNVAAYFNLSVAFSEVLFLLCTFSCHHNISSDTEVKHFAIGTCLLNFSLYSVMIRWVCIFLDLKTKLF